MPRVSMGFPLLAMMSLAGPSPTFADVVLPDPLAGYCAGAGQCVHGSVDAPTSANPPWISVSPPLAGHRRAIC